MTISGEGGLSGPGPACRPARFGLRSAADVAEKAGYEWARGGEWDELPCGVDLGITGGQCPALPEQHVKSTSRGYDTKDAGAFTVYAGWGCNAIMLSQAWANAEELLMRNWWRTLELALWTGIDQDGESITQTLNTPDVTDLTPAAGALDITSGVAVLESFASDCNDCEPIIHANRGLAPYFSERSLTYRDGDVLRLENTGSLFVPGGGYQASGPEGIAAEPDEAWMYVSGPVSITHGPTFFAPDRDDAAGAVDRLVNDVTVFAERMVMIQVSCCVGAVRVALDSCCGGGNLTGDES